MEIKRFKKIILCVMLILLVVCVAFAVHYREYIKVAYYGFRYDDKKINALIEENDNKYKQLGDELTQVEVRDLTEEEKQSLSSGDITEEEIIDRIVTPKPSEKTDGKTDEPAQKPPQEKQEDAAQDSEYDALIAEQIAKMYVLKSQYINYLKGIEQNVINDYNALPEEKKNAAGKRSVIMSYYNRGLELEAECDAKVEAVLGDLSQILQRAGRDNSLITAIRDAYKNEKTLQKSYYLSIYNN